MRKNLKPEDLGDLLDGSTVAVLATHMKDGHTLLSPVWPFVTWAKRAATPTRLRTSTWK